MFVKLHGIEGDVTYARHSDILRIVDLRSVGQEELADNYSRYKIMPTTHVALRSEGNTSGYLCTDTAEDIMEAVIASMQYDRELFKE